MHHTNAVQLSLNNARTRAWTWRRGQNPGKFTSLTLLHPTRIQTAQTQLTGTAKFSLCFLSCPGRRQLSSSRNQPFRNVLLAGFLYIVSRLCVVGLVGPVGPLGPVDPVGPVGLVSPADPVSFVLRYSCQAVFRIAQPCWLKSFSVFFLSFLS